MNKSKWLRLELLGIIFVFFSGALLYCCYMASNKAVWAILFALVNESIWEHIKIITMPYIIWSFIELCFVPIGIKKFFVVKTISVYLLIIGIIFSFFVYYGIAGYHILIVDIFVSLILILGATFFSYNFILSDFNFESLFLPAIILFALFISMYLMFTVLPPKMYLFCDPITNMYGVC